VRAGGKRSRLERQLWRAGGAAEKRVNSGQHPSRFLLKRALTPFQLHLREGMDDQ
jgi:hypothetical protein